MDIRHSSSSSPRPTIWLDDADPPSRLIAEALKADLQDLNVHLYPLPHQQSMDRTPPDLAICHVDSPTENLEALLQRMRKRPEMDQVPILLLLGALNEDCAEQLSSFEAVDFVTEPFSVREMAARARRLISSKRRPHSDNQIKQALKESEEKFRIITNAMPQMVWSTRADGYHDYFNRQWYLFTGVPEGSTDGDEWNNLFHPGDRARARELWRHSLETGEPYDIQYRVRHHSGEYRWALGRALPIRNDRGEIVRWMGTCTDIHVQKMAEEALHEASERKDHFLAMLAHELRGPLSPLYNCVWLMRNVAPPDQQLSAALDIMERQLSHMSNLINDLLDVARISRGKMQLRKELCELNAIVGQCAEDARSYFDTGGIAFEVDCGDEELWLQGDATRIAQALGNVLHNASKFTKSGGNVRLATRRRSSPAGDWATITVRDSGIGLDPKLAAHLFDPFVQADQDLGRAAGGLGLGLPVVKGLVELHGGTVAAHSDGPGQGTTFTLEFPLDRAIAKAPPASEKDDGSQTGKLRIVLIDDNRDMIDTMSALLQIQGHEVVSALDASSGLEAIRSAAPDLVICDIGLPGAMDGYGLARAVREEQDAKIAKVFLIALSGYGQESDRQKSKESGFDMHLLKPVNFDELNNALERASTDIVEH